MHLEEFDSSESETSSDASAEDLNPPSGSAPLTPFSSVSSPRFPSNLKTISCTFPDCRKLFNRPAKLAQHLRSHTNTRPYVCPNSSCAKDFLRDSHLKHHIKSQHSDVRDYVCDWDGCGKSFITGTRLRRHNAVHKGENKIRCVIIGCGQVFRKHGTLQKHIKVVHEGKSPFVCTLQSEEGEDCGTGFDAASKLKSHEGRVHGGKRFWCTLCSSNTQENGIGTDQETLGMRFSTYTELQAHLGREHPPTCTDCGLQCKSQRELKAHVDILHGSFGVDERRTHACPEPECGRGFTKKGNLNAHIKTVHGEKKFTCGGIDLSSLNNIGTWDGSNACGRGLSTKGNLEEHIRTTHLNLDHSRKNKKEKIKSLPPHKIISPLTRLTGAGYENESGRHISCLLPGCEFQFFRDHDLETHLRLYHGIPNHAIENLQKGVGTLVNRPTLDGSFVLATNEDLEAEQALDAQFGGSNWMDDLQKNHQEDLSMSQDLIFGSQSEANNAGEMWMPYSLEMRLASTEDNVAGEYVDQDIEMIDPHLR